MALGHEYLGPGCLEVLFGKGLADLLHEDQGGHEGERPQNHPDASRVLA
jgi:hypothetical protein